jgi:hypothetical protein
LYIADERCAVVDCVLHAENTGIEVRDVVGAVVSGNVIHTAGWAGILVWRSGAVTTDINVIGNVIYSEYTAGFAFGIELYGGDAANHVQRINVIANVVVGAGAASTYGLRVIDYVDNAALKDNMVYNWATGIEITNANSVGTVVKDNRFLACTTIIIDNGTETILPTIVVPFSHGTDPQDSGFLVDATAEYARAFVFLPKEVQKVVRIKVYARAAVLSATTMAAEFVIYGGADNEPYTTHNGSVTNHPSTSSNFAADDVIFWTITTAGALALLGGDSVEVKVLYNATAVATAAYFRTVAIEYV